MTLREMLTLKMLGEDDTYSSMFKHMTDEEKMKKVHSHMRLYVSHWYITEDASKVEKLSSMWVKTDEDSIQAIELSGFYLAEVWDMNWLDESKELVRLRIGDQLMESLGWELIPTKYYDREVEGT